MQILIGGVDKSSLYKVNSLELGDEINARSTCRFQLVDKTGAYHPLNGATVAIYDNSASLIFGGFVKEPDENVLWGTSALSVNVDCVDNQSIADWRLITESYDNMTTGAIVKDIIDTTLAEEGVWYNPYALSFDGVDDVVSVPDSASLDTPTALTVEAWIFDSNDGTIFHSINRDGAARIWIIRRETDTTGNFHLWNSAGTLRSFKPANSWKINEWFHCSMVAFVDSGLIHIKIYINGVLVGTDSFAGTAMQTGNQPVLMGANTAISGFKRQLLDDVRIWNTERTPAEILANYNRELIGTETGLVGYWKFNEGSGSTAIDSAGSNNGTISGATYTTDVWDGGQSIQDGVTATRAVFPRVQATSAFEELAEMSGFTWWVESNKRFYFVDRSTYLAPFNITATSPIRNVNYRRNEDQYRNKQYIRAGQDTTDPQVANFKGDGAQRTFTVAYDIAQTPVIEVNTGAGYVAKTVGIRGLETGKQWYWNKGEKEVSQDDTETVLSATDLMRLPSYVGFFPILTVSEDGSAIAARKAVSGGTGIREAIEQQASIDSADAALEIAQGKLVKYARIGGELTFETDTDGLEVGQIITVTLSIHEISGVEFLIDRITVSEPFADQALRYYVHAVDGQALGNWTTFFKALSAKATSFSIRDNEVLIKLKSAVDAITVAESLSKVAAAPESRVGFATVGYSQIG